MTSAPGRGRVLVVDDEPLLRDLVLRLLARKGRGIDARAASTAEDALALLEEWNADLVLSDYRMPGRDGASLLAEVRERWPRTRRALMTGHTELWEDAGLDHADVALVIAKPLQTDDLLAKIHGLLDGA